MTDGIECSHCGKDLGPDGTQPCPHCGNTGRTINVSIKEHVVLKDDHAMGITQGETGRYAVHSNSRNPTDSELIEGLVREYLAGLVAPFENYVDNLVNSFNAVATFTGAFYRGVSSDIQGGIKGTRIGPSPTPRQGRYNATGEKCLYLIDNIFYLRPEIEAQNILVQNYRIPLSKMRVADLSAESKAIGNSLSLVFQLTERGKTGAGLDFELELQKQGRSRYVVSQSAAKAFKKHGWQGLYVPGVHGRLGQTYKNLVLFGNCVDSWEEWTIGKYYTLSSEKN